MSLDEIEAYQDEMEQYLEAHYGKNWQKVRIPEDEFARWLDSQLGMQILKSVFEGF